MDSADTTNNAEFHIQNEDFPALPGTEGSQDVPVLGRQTGRPMDLHAAAAAAVAGGGGMTGGDPAAGIITHISGACANIPPTMLADQFGMAGLLSFLRQAENPAIVSLALGTDLTTLGLNLNLNEIQDLDATAQVPEEYLTNSTIRDKLPNIKLAKLSEDVLFYLFYNCPGEVYQMAAASELYGRDWRFHKEFGFWLTRSMYGGGVKEQTPAFESGSYTVFDPVTWRKIPKDMRLEYSELEERPKLPAALNHPAGTAPAAAAGSNGGLPGSAPNPNGAGNVPPRA